MSKWLDLSNNANKFKQSYFKGFLDISGGGIYLRNDFSMNFYNSVDLANPKLSIKSDKMHIYDGVSSYVDVSNTKLIYLKNVSGDIQTQFNNLANQTKYISSDSSSITTIIELDSSGSKATIYGNLQVTGNCTFQANTISKSAIIGGVGDFYIGNTDNVTFDNDQFALMKTGTVQAGIYTNLGFGGTITVIGDASLNGNTFLNGNATLNGNTYLNGNTFAITQPITTNSNLVATTAYVQNQGYTTQQTLFRQFAS
jgi:hypothetical protein